ncbi:MAG: PTS sugar transporter subunit IIA [Elusimicrobia bacterium]|nr:PTS sugar transporter subunit IIA [Elusimicrobiota bacterium]
MVKILKYLSEKTIKTNTAAQSKNAVIKELVDLLVGNSDISKRSSKLLYRAILKRETVGTTGIGQGIALPHVKIKYVKGLRIAFVNSKNGIEFNSLDGEPVFIVFLLVGNSSAEQDYIRILSTIAQYLNDPYFRRDLINADTARQVIKVIKSKEE